MSGLLERQKLLDQRRREFEQLEILDTDDLRSGLEEAGVSPDEIDRRLKAEVGNIRATTLASLYMQCVEKGVPLFEMTSKKEAAAKDK